jgi:transcriptional regulator with XRE-family HTH domain
VERFGKRLKRLREAKGWDTEEFSAHCGLPKGIYENFERGDVQTLTVRDVKFFAKKFEVTGSYLFEALLEDREYFQLRMESTQEFARALQTLLSIDLPDLQIVVDTSCPAHPIYCRNMAGTVIPEDQWMALEALRDIVEQVDVEWVESIIADRRRDDWNSEIGRLD